MTSYDNWLRQFQDYLRQSGLPEAQVQRYDNDREYSADARAYFDKGVSAGDAAVREIMGR